MDTSRSSVECWTKSGWHFAGKDIELLNALGEWMDINGEGIYETSFWKKSGEGPTVTEEGHFTDVLEHSFTLEDFRFTYKNGCIFAFSMK